MSIEEKNGFHDFISDYFQTPIETFKFNSFETKNNGLLTFVKRQGYCILKGGNSFELSINQYEKGIQLSINCEARFYRKNPALRSIIDSNPLSVLLKSIHGQKIGTRHLDVREEHYLILRDSSLQHKDRLWTFVSVHLAGQSHTPLLRLKYSQDEVMFIDDCLIDFDKDYEYNLLSESYYGENHSGAISVVPFDIFSRSLYRNAIYVYSYFDKSYFPEGSCIDDIFEMSSQDLLIMIQSLNDLQQMGKL